MSTLYIHIPFCKKACHYCNFHFSTSTQYILSLLEALIQELFLRKNEYQDTTISTIYLGGGTPTVLSAVQLEYLIRAIYQNYQVADDVEMTIEANPDDLTEEVYLSELSRIGFNRLSIGVQAFDDALLTQMNRGHTNAHTMQVIPMVQKYFSNISIDLIYGFPKMTLDQWQKNVEIALSFTPQHISAYALTVEPNTALEHFITQKKYPPMDTQIASTHYYQLIEMLETEHYEHYEISNFGKVNYFSQANSAYWLGKPYMGIGPSAHSYDGHTRSWNVSNNKQYIVALKENKRPSTQENLTENDRYNEYVMTNLRCSWGVDLLKIKEDLGDYYLKNIHEHSKKYITQELVTIENDILKVTKKGLFFCDGIASDLFVV